MNLILMLWGLCVAAMIWALTGVLLFTLSPIYVTPKAPLMAKVRAVGWAAIMYPYLLLTGHSPTKTIVLITPKHQTPEQREAMLQWLALHCPCDQCRERRHK